MVACVVQHRVGVASVAQDVTPHCLKQLWKQKRLHVFVSTQGNHFGTAGPHEAQKRGIISLSTLQLGMEGVVGTSMKRNLVGGRTGSATAVSERKRTGMTPLVLQIGPLTWRT